MNKRCLALNDKTNTNGKCVFYVMSRDQRIKDNHALLEAQAEAIEKKVPLTVLFNVLKQTGERTREHYEFMIEGLKEIEKDLRAKNIPFTLTIGSMSQNVLDLAKAENPASIYFDFSPLRGPRKQQKEVAKNAAARVIVVDTHNIIPTWVTSDKEEFAAHTIRRKIHKNIEEWVIEPETVRKHPHMFKTQPQSQNWSDIETLVNKIPKSGIKHNFIPGESAARKALQRFVDKGLEKYASDRNDPTTEGQSELSPYLHYGHLASLRIVLDIVDSTNHEPHLFKSFKMPNASDTPGRTDGIDAFFEELIVRKELSDNFCLHQPSYDRLKGAKDWAKESLDKHKKDSREHVYTYEQLEKAETHDEMWNAAQQQLIQTGKIHGYMRMYWAKMFLAWTESPATAIRWAIKMNDKFHLDGGDPNGYVGVMWSIAGIHDRPWFERDVFGKIRFMSANGMKKKFDTEAYKNMWS